MKRPTKYWPKAILLVDMNAFFASVEQYDNPELRGRPIAITNGEQGSCIITCSYEARRFGVKTGMRLHDAKMLCPHLLRVPSHPHRYAEVSRAIMQALGKHISPDIEIYSVDEAFLDVTHCQRLHGHPADIGKMAKQVVWETSGLTCSVGVSGDKTTAKFAAEAQKPDGLTVIAPWESKARLANEPVTKIWGVNQGVGRFLARYGAYTCGDVAKLPISVLAKRFGNVGRRIWYQCQGQDPDKVKPHTAAPKSMGHGKVMPPNTQDKAVILTYLLHMSEKLAARLRRHELEAQVYFIGLKTDFGWVGGHYKLERPDNNAKLIFSYCRYMLQQRWHGQGVHQVQITALSPVPANLQLELFGPNRNPDEAKKQHAVDAINARFGELTLAPARLLNRSPTPNVIAPAWRPDGHRQSIE